jgi:uncharacterized membrane protein YgcG
MTVTITPQPSGDEMDFAAALDDAIAQLRAGVPLQQCLAAQPALADDLRPLLEMAAFTMQAAPATPLPGAKARVRAAVLAAAEEQLARRPWWNLGLFRRWRWQPAGFAAAGAAALLALSGGGAVVASANALPGDPLYAVKLATEDARLAVAQATGKPEDQAAIHVEIAQRRIDEAKFLADQGRPVPPGLLESALRQAEVAERKVAELPEPQRAQAAAKLEAAHEHRTEALNRVKDKAPETAQAAISQALDDGRQRGDGRDAGERGQQAAAGQSGANSGPGRSTALGFTAPAASSGASKGEAKDDKDDKDDKGGPSDERQNQGNEGRAGEGNGRDEGRGRQSAAEPTADQPGVRDAILAVATAVGPANAAGPADEDRGNRAGPPSALPRGESTQNNGRDDNPQPDGRDRPNGSPSGQRGSSPPSTAQVTPAPRAANNPPANTRSRQTSDGSSRQDRGGGAGSSGGAGASGRR